MLEVTLHTENRQNVFKTQTQKQNRIYLKNKHKNKIEYLSNAKHKNKIEYLPNTKHQKKTEYLPNTKKDRISFKQHKNIFKKLNIVHKFMCFQAKIPA